MDPMLKSLIASLRSTIPMLVRSAPASEDYLEGVLAREELQRCCALLSERLAPPIKDFGKAAAFEPPVQKVVASLGGIRLEQCLFLKQGEEGHAVYAALWPWASDPLRITLKVGVSRL